VVEAGQGETHGRAQELVKLNSVMAGWGVTILIFARSLFGFEFGGEAVKSSVVRATSDLREWKPLKTFDGSAKRSQFTPE
jgi:hypothetical protein|tara:strand:- start:222 stop:461 length:240 start_codon:yes stop_codon:yes gene_type:complete